MKMSCNGCRVLRKGCSDDCIIRPCLEWIKSPESQANATVFLAKFYGRAGLMNLISAGPDHLRPAIFRSLLYEACGRLANPVYGSTGLLMAGKWWVCQSAVENILKGVPITPFQANADDDDAAGASAAAAAAAMDSGDGGTAQAPKKLQPEKTKLMEAIANELRKVKTKGRFKRAARRAAAAAAADDDDVVVVMKLEPELPVMASAISQSQSQSQSQFQSQSQVVFNLRGRRCYSRGSSNNKYVTASSDSSCHSARNNNEPNHNNSNNNPIEIISCLHRSSSNTAEDAEDVTLELTLCSQQQTHATPSSVAAAAAGCALFVTSNRKFETEDEQPTESSNDADDDGQDASALTCLGLSLSAA